MPHANPGEIPFSRLRGFLVSLGFEQSVSVNHSRAFLHPQSETVLVVSASQEDEPVRPADLLSVLVRLESTGLASESELQQFRLGTLPKAS